MCCAAECIQERSASTQDNVANGHAPAGLSRELNCMTTPTEFLENFALKDAPPEVASEAKRCLMDLIGVAAGGSRTELSRIICAHAAEEFGGDVPILFSDQTASSSGAALAGGMTIDALDGHDGYNPAKGHIGCGLLPALLALAGDDGDAFLQAFILGYEFGGRFAVTLHSTAPDYHTSGAWIAPTIAAVCGPLAGLTTQQLPHAVGIAEYHGPRSQMMRCIDHPTMLKDGSGWGAMAGVSAVRLAAAGFTGAPAITWDGPEWRDLGARWVMLEQYIKPYPVCRWAHAPVEAALALRKKHGLTSEDIDAVQIITFHEACRLAENDPQTTEAAQYSTSYPVALALVDGAVQLEALTNCPTRDPEVARIAKAITMGEDDLANAKFPTTRLAKVALTLRDGREVVSDWTEPKWDYDDRPTDAELEDKYRALAEPVLGVVRAQAVLDAIAGLEGGYVAPLRAALAGAP